MSELRVILSLVVVAILMIGFITLDVRSLAERWVIMPLCIASSLSLLYCIGKSWMT